MGRIKQLREIFATSFDDSADWQKWFFGSVATDDNQAVLVHDANGRPVSGLLMQPYAFRYDGIDLPSLYLSCVATRPEARGKGKASELILKALRMARDQGAALAELIPASRELFFFYARSGFSGVFYVAEERYTSLHPFAGAGAEEVEPSFDIFHTLELATPNCVLHTASDYTAIRADLEMEPGHQTLSVLTPDGAGAILFATYDTTKTDSGVLVRSLLADSETAATAALAALRRRVGERPLTVWRPAARQPKARLRARGMARIIDPKALLGALAAAHPELRYTIRLTDRPLPENSGTYTLTDGRCTFSPTAPTRRPDLNVDPATLTAILFSHPEAGAIFDLPTARPYIAMMLD